MQRAQQHQSRMRHLEQLRSEQSLAAKLQSQTRDNYRRHLDAQILNRTHLNAQSFSSGEAQYRDELDKLMAKQPDYPTLPN